MRQTATTRFIITSTVSSNHSNGDINWYKKIWGNRWDEVRHIYDIKEGDHEKNITDKAIELYDILNTTITNLLLNIKPVNEIQFGPIVKMSFHDRIWEFRAVDESGEKALHLGQLLRIVERTVKCNGSLFIFNTDILKNYRSAEIIAILRVKVRLSVTEIKVALDELHTKFRVADIRPPIEISTIEQGINFLLPLGILNMDPYSDDKYMLTAKGYMLWL